MSHEHEEDIHQEHTLLIDPCYDDPELYFGYDTAGNIIALDREENPYAEESIRVFHLDLRRLCRERRKAMKRAVSFVKLIAKCEREGPKGVARGLRMMLEEMKSDESEYAGVARFVAENSENFFGESS